MEYSVIDIKRLMELETHHWKTITGISDSGKTNQCLLKLLGNNILINDKRKNSKI